MTSAAATRRAFLMGMGLEVLGVMAGPARRFGFLGVALGLIVTVGCADGAPSKRLPGGYRLVQKDQFQALYGPNGRIVRLLYDRSRDGRAESVVLYWPNGKPQRGELDTDEDGAIDRWEHFRTDGALDRVDVDTNRDGKVDRTDYPQ
jgi:hypothetical protein